jgi:hypothetical protein
MKTAEDTTSCKQALVTCQAQLHGYVKCMDAALEPKAKSWWKVL